MPFVNIRIVKEVIPALAINANSALAYGVQRPCGAQRARRAGGRACAEGAAAKPARRPAQLPSVLRTGGGRALCRALRGGGGLRAADDPGQPGIQRAMPCNTTRAPVMRVGRRGLQLRRGVPGQPFGVSPV